MNIKFLSFLALLIFVGVTSCTEESTNELKLNLTGLENLGDGYVYEGWIIVDGAAVTTGIFTVNDNGDLSKTDFTAEGLEEASKFVLTIEPANDTDPAPSKVHLVAGDFNGSSATLTVGDDAALANDFTSSTGGFILATPTDSDPANETSGVWFLDNSSGSPAVGLQLPTLPEGWEYEGWAVIDGQPVTTGKFTAFDAADSAASYSGDVAGPPFPGEDFLNNAPDGLTFPTDLRGATAVISIEPSPDNSANPFLLKPLVTAIDADAADHTFISLGNNAANTNPTGSVTRG